MPISWFDDIEIEVLAGFSAASGEYGVWGVGEWGTATWGPDVVFTDISEWVRSIQTSRGFARELAEWRAGTASLVLNNQDGRFSPSNPNSPYVVGGLTGIRPWRPIVVNVAGFPIFTGYVISWQESYDQGSPRGGGVSVVVQCVDEQSALARVEGLVTVAQGGGEMSGERIHRILDNAGHTGPRAIGVGRVTLQPTTHELNTVTEMQLVTDSEGGALYVDADGAVTFENRYYLVESDRSNRVQATFGDGGWQSVLSLTGGSASAPDTSGLAITGDLDVRMHVALDDWTPSGIFGNFLLSQWPNAANNNGWMIGITSTNRIQLAWSPDGTLAAQETRQSTELPVFVDGTFHWVRATLDVNNGAAGNDTRFYTSEDGENWTQLGGVVNDAGTTSVFNSTVDLAVSVLLPFNGRVRSAEVRNGIGGPVVANPDFALQIGGTTSFDDEAGNTWTLTGNAAIVDDLTVPAELPYNGITPAYDGDQLVNIVSLSRVQTADEEEADIAPPVTTVQDETSKALYGDSRYTRTDLVNDSDADLGGVAEFYLETHKEPEQRVEQISFSPRSMEFGAATRDLLVAQAVERRVRDRVRVIRRPPGSETIVRDCHIAGIGHSLDDEGGWQVTFDLWSASVYDEFDASFWDSAEWDDASWFF